MNRFLRGSLLACSFCCSLSLFAQTHLHNRGAIIQVPEGQNVSLPGNYHAYPEGQLTGGLQLDGRFGLGGNWHNHTPEPALVSRDSLGLLIFEGNSPQYLYAFSPETFENIQLNNPMGLSLEQDLHVLGQLHLVQGKVFTDMNELTMWSSDPQAILGADSARYIIGTLNRKVSAQGTYRFPIGSMVYLEEAQIAFQSAEIPEFVRMGFTVAVLDTPVGMDVAGGKLIDILDYGYWTVEASEPGTYEFSLQVNGQGHSNGGPQPEQHILLSKPFVEWEDLGQHVASQNSGSGAGPITVKRNNLEELGIFAIGKTAYAIDLGEDTIFSSLHVLHNGPDGQAASLIFHSAKTQTYKLEAFDLNGRKLFTLVGLALPGENNIALNLHRYPQGVNLLRLWDEKRNYSFKIW